MIGVVASSYAPAVAGWAPTDIAGCQLWLDADDAATFTYSSGVVVSQWDDKSGNGRHVSQGTVANQPSRNGTQNGRTTVVFDGTNDVLAGANQSAQASQTWFFVMQDTGTQFQSGQFCRWGNIRFDRNNDASETLTFSKIGVVNHATGQAIGSAWNVWTWSIATNVMTLYKDGASLYTSGSNAINTSSAAFTVGAASSYFRGEMAEVIVYSTALSGTDRQAVEDYLSAKWGTP